MLARPRVRALGRAFGALLTAIAVMLASGSVRADEASGTWTGAVALWGNYYWETSTRVEAPSVAFRLSSPDGIDVHGEYLLDAITSASVAAGVIADVRFTEIRHQGTIGVGHELDLGEAQLRLDVSGRVSAEPDYLASGVTLSGSLSLAERCSVIGFSLGYIHDEVGAIVRGGPPRVDPATGRDLSNRGRLGQLEGVNLSIAYTQILAAWALATIGYDFVHNDGFIQNAYRQVQVQGALQPEHHPDQRTRHSFYGRLAMMIPQTHTAFHLNYRVYVDDWGIGALTPEARIYQEVGEDVTLRVRYRYYNQLRSFFYRPDMQYRFDDEFVTADQKMADFETHLLGFRVLVSLGFLGGGPLDFLSRGHFTLSFDYLWQGSRFGNAVLSQTGLEVPF